MGLFQLLPVPYGGDLLGNVPGHLYCVVRGVAPQMLGQDHVFQPHKGIAAHQVLLNGIEARTQELPGAQGLGGCGVVHQLFPRC